MPPPPTPTPQTHTHVPQAVQYPWRPGCGLTMFWRVADADDPYKGEWWRGRVLAWRPERTWEQLRVVWLDEEGKQADQVGPGGAGRRGRGGGGK